MHPFTPLYNHTHRTWGSLGNAANPRIETAGGGGGSSYAIRPPREKWQEQRDDDKGPGYGHHIETTTIQNT